MEELLHWFKLCNAEGLGLRAAHKLLEHFGTPDAILSASPDALRHIGCSALCIAALKSEQTESFNSLIGITEQWLLTETNTALSYHDEDYPDQLKAIADPPLVLYTSGDISLLANPAVAIVGSRKASAPALRLTTKLSSELSASGITVVSGLAIGVDKMAHQASLDGIGGTIAVAATGLDRVYPAGNRQLAAQIRESGLLVSEFPLGTAPKPFHFPRRNRIISGLSIGVLVIEAAIKSGTLTTARHAADQGRTVMAVPGSVYNPLSKGCHYLINQGATLVQSASEILSEICPQIDMDPRITAGSSPTELPLIDLEDPVSIELMGCMGYEPASIDMLVSLTGRASRVISTQLLKLELDGHIVSVGAGRYIRC